MTALPPAIFLMGPTASGKTAAAVELVQQLPVEIISVDSALVYRGMDIGTAKPDSATLAIAPHHLIDVREPPDAYSAANFHDDALALMQDISARGKIPLLAGGTMLYFKALREGLSDLPSANAELRAELEEDARQHGWPALRARLAQLDPATAERLKPNDSQRIQRALEVCIITGEPMSTLLAQQQQRSLPWTILPLALIPSDRSVLHQRIAERFDAMLQQGIIDEVAQLRRQYPQLTLDTPSMRAVGYRQGWEYLDGEYDLPTLRDKGIAATRQLAKRQLTWLRSMDGNIEIDCLQPQLSQHVGQICRNWVNTL